MLKDLRKLDYYSEKLFVFSPSAITLVVAPGLTYDPINLPKLVLLSTIGVSLLPYICYNFKLLKSTNRLLFSLVLIFLMSTLMNVPTSKVGALDALWGTWGRFTGSLTYSLYVLFVFAAAIFVIKNGPERILRSFTLCGYAIIFYTLIQFMELDPLPWSQKLPIATLGNINFMSAFLGLISIHFSCTALNRDSSLSKKIYFLLLVLISSLLIWYSESIQGIAILAAGLCTFFAIRIWEKGRNFALSFYAFSIVLGSTLLLGSAGVGPLSKWIVQTTALYRVDYWIAGLRIFTEYPIFGVGLDGYGEYYREFRTLEAATRTGPGRVTNSAHNVFIDLLSGAGFVAGLSLFFVVISCILIAWRVTIKARLQFDTLPIAPLICGWLVFMAISIGQIGINIWGFVLCGLTLGLSEKIHSLGDRKISSRPSREAFGHPDQEQMRRTRVSKIDSRFARSIKQSFTIVTVFLSTASFGAALVLPPALADYRFMLGVKGQDLNSISEVSKSRGASNYYREYLVDSLISSGRIQEATIEARELVELEPRSWRGWVAIALSPVAKPHERRVASETLKKLDPNNMELQAAPIWGEQNDTG